MLLGDPKHAHKAFYGHDIKRLQVPLLPLSSSWAGSGISKFVDLLGALNCISGTYLGCLDSQGKMLVARDSPGTFKLVVDMKGHVNVSVMVLWNPNESSNALAKLARPKFYTCCCVVLCFPVVVLQALNVRVCLPS